MIATYQETVSDPYHDYIVAQDETFFLSVPDKDILKAAKKADAVVDASMLTMIRALGKILEMQTKLSYGISSVFSSV
jgi:ribosomal protein L9